MFKNEGPSFLPKYEEFLRLAGSDSAENVVKRTVRRDLERSDFWIEAIRTLEEPLQRLEALLPKVLSA
jgi:oligoendopeptidase F